MFAAAVVVVFVVVSIVVVVAAAAVAVVAAVSAAVAVVAAAVAVAAVVVPAVANVMLSFFNVPYVVRALDCKIQAITQQGSPEYSLIMQYVNNSKRSDLKVENIYKVSREWDEQHFAEDIRFPKNNNKSNKKKGKSGKEKKTSDDAEGKCIYLLLLMRPYRLFIMARANSYSSISILFILTISSITALSKLSFA